MYEERGDKGTLKLRWMSEERGDEGSVTLRWMYEEEMKSYLEADV